MKTGLPRFFRYTNVFFMTFALALICSFGTIDVAKGQALPTGWSSQDIGAVIAPGSVIYNDGDGSFTVTGSGHDIYGDADGLRYVYKSLDGDGQITVRVAAHPLGGAPNGWEYAGLNIRESLAAGAANVSWLLTPAHGINFQKRLTTGGQTIDKQSRFSSVVPIFLRLSRVGNTVRGYSSQDGITWVSTDTTVTDITLPHTIYLGMAVCAITDLGPDNTTTATFDNVNVESLAPVVDVTSPTEPGNLTVSELSNTSFILSWTASTDNVGVTGYNVYKNAVLFDSTKALTDTITGLTGNTSYQITVKAKDAANNLSDAAGKVVVTSIIPYPWQTKDIGAVGVVGSVAYSSGTFTVTGSGSDIYNAADQFRYVYQKLGTYGQITAQIPSRTIGGGDPDWAYAGLNVRESLDPGSINVSFLVTPTHGINFEKRLTTGGSTSDRAKDLHAVPVWVRLARVANKVYAYSSTNGTDWVGVDTATITMKDTIFVGMAVCAVNNSATTSANFSNVSIEAIDTQAPTAPLGLGANTLLPTSLTLAWTAATDNIGVTGYDVYQDGVLIGSSAGVSFNVTALTENTVYEFSVKAKDQAGNISEPSAVLTLTTRSTCEGTDNWINHGFDSNHGTFAVEYDVIPGSPSMDGVTGLSYGDPGGFGDLACIVQFFTDNQVHVRNAGVYSSDVPVHYVAGTSYHIKMMVDVANKKYDVNITPEGESEIAIASQYSFRAQDTSLNNFTIVSTYCHLTVSNLSIPGLSEVTGVNTVNENNVLVYPNPASGNVYVKISNRAEMTLTDLTGKLVYKQVCEPGVNEIKLNVKPGIYLIQLSGDKMAPSFGKLVVK